MKRFLILFVFIVCIYFYFVTRNYRMTYTSVQAAPQQTHTEYPSPTFVPTRTEIPTATVGYQETLAVAQSTADEARRINAQVTSEFEQRALEQLQMTAAYEERVQEIYSWTATAALTAIPLTATQQAVINTQIPAHENIVAAQLTATQYAPTQMVLMVRAQDSVRFSRMDNWVRIFATFAIGIFALGLGSFLFKYPVQPMQHESPKETVVMLKRENGQGFSSLERTVIPCSPEQLNELAEKITHGEKTLAINQWEGAGTLFTRPVIHQVRGWMHLNNFAVGTGDGQLVPTQEGLNFFIAWLESQKLPDEYEFVEVEPVP